MNLGKSIESLVQLTVRLSSQVFKLNPEKTFPIKLNETKSINKLNASSVLGIPTPHKLNCEVKPEPQQKHAPRWFSLMRSDRKLSTKKAKSEIVP